ncbi:MAG: sigma-70 family RNA polymerase sigma factor [Nibricoccus sp.]
MIEDSELLRRYVAEHSEPAFADLVSRHVDLVYSVALRTVGGDAHSAQDVAQGVFIALARNAPSLLRHQALAGWLYLTTHHTAAQAVRAARRRQHREEQATTMNEIQNSTDIEWHRLRPVLDETMRDLNELDREAILLRFFEKRPFADIGAALRVKEDAARMRVDRAIEKLRTLLAKRGVNSTAAALSMFIGSQVVAAPVSLSTNIANAIAAAPLSKAIPLGHFMKPHPIVIASLAVVAIGAAVVFATAVKKNQTELTSMPKANVSTVSKIATIDTPRASPETIRATFGSPATKATAMPAEESATAHVPDNVARESWISRMVDDYDPMLNKLQLPPERAAAFKMLIRDNLRLHGDLGVVWRTAGLKPADPDVESLANDADSTLARQIRTEFGEVVFAAFQHFNETAPVREFASHVSQALTGTPTPLTAVQSEQLVEILHRNRTRGEDGKLSDYPRAFDLSAVIVQARSFLSDPQLTALKKAFEAAP